MIGPRVKISTPRKYPLVHHNLNWCQVRQALASLVRPKKFPPPLLPTSSMTRKHWCSPVRITISIIMTPTATTLLSTKKKCYLITTYRWWMRSSQILSPASSHRLYNCRNLRSTKKRRRSLLSRAIKTMSTWWQRFRPVGPIRQASKTFRSLKCSERAHTVRSSSYCTKRQISTTPWKS